MNELQNITIQTPNAPAFHSQKLNEYTAQILKAGADMRSANREIATILARASQLTKDTWEQDGFKGVGDYAEKTFGIKQSMCSAMVKVGKAFYLSSDPARLAIADTVSPSNLAEVAKLSDADIDTAIADGTIHAGATQDELRKARKAIADKSATPAVLPAYNVTVNGFASGTPYTREYHSVTEPEAVENLKAEHEGAYTADAYAWVRLAGKKDDHVAVLYDANTASFAVAHFVAVGDKSAKHRNGEVHKFTREELLAALAAMDNADNA